MQLGSKFLIITTIFFIDRLALLYKKSPRAESLFVKPPMSAIANAL